MVDIWGFLLQTLTASGVAVLLLVVRGLFRDKLPPKWHFALWGVLGIVLLVPAGWNGRYTLVHWQTLIEMLKIWAGEFGSTRVLFPFPVITGVPSTWEQWLFVAYVVGAMLHLGWYGLSYCRLRRILDGSGAASHEVTQKVSRIAAELGIRPCRVVAVKGSPSAFVCGILRPILVVPEGGQLDDRILLHELLHLKNRDTLWSAVICVLRSLHWCSPLLVWCAGRAVNDMECRCDQLVLDRLEGEQRRDYGHILLSMVNDRFTRTPGTTCVNNGGKQIRERIRAIAWYRRYPAGMGMVSVCVLILLTLPLVIGVQATELYEPSHTAVLASFASARSTPCTTYAGAFDAYGKAILMHNGYYRSMCAPASMQETLYGQILKRSEQGLWPAWDSGAPVWPVKQEGYYVYGLEQTGKDSYEGLMVFKGAYPPDGKPEEFGKMYLLVQALRVEKEEGRWVAIPLEGFRMVEAVEQSLAWGCMELPGNVYTDTVGKLRVDVKVQTVYTVDNLEETDLIWGRSASYDMDPKPHARFGRAAKTLSKQVTHSGTQPERDEISGLGVSVAPVYRGEDPPKELAPAGGYGSGGGDNLGNSWAAQKTEPGWGPSMELGGGGGGTFDPEKKPELPAYFVADLYVDGLFYARTELYPQEGAS